MDTIIQHRLLKELSSVRVKLVDNDSPNGYIVPLEFNGYDNWKEYEYFLNSLYEDFKIEFEKSILEFDQQRISYDIISKTYVDLSESIVSLKKRFYKIEDELDGDPLIYTVRRDISFTDLKMKDRWGTIRNNSEFLTAFVDTQENIIDKLEVFLNTYWIRYNSINGPQKKSKHPSSPIDLAKLFKEKAYFDTILQKLLEMNPPIVNFDRIGGKYYWIGELEYLAALAVKLRNKHHLNEELLSKSNQKLRISFCSFFNIDSSEKPFQPGMIDETKMKRFTFINDFK